MTWQYESRRHSLAARGIKTTPNNRTPIRTAIIPLKLYHGTSREFANEILMNGINADLYHPVYLTPNIDIARKYAVKGANYPPYDEDIPEEREPVIFEITLTGNEDNFQGEVGEIRLNTLKQAIDENWHEYVYYKPIPPEKLRIIT